MQCNKPARTACQRPTARTLHIFAAQVNPNPPVAAFTSSATSVDSGSS